MKVVLEGATMRGESGFYPRDIELVGVKFCEFEWDGWISVWFPVGDEEMPVQQWLIDNDGDVVRVWSTSDDEVNPGNWVYQCRRVSIMEDD